MLKIKEELILNEKYFEILIVCDGTQIKFKNENNIDGVVKFICEHSESGLVGIKDSFSNKIFYVNPNKISLVKDITKDKDDKEVVFKINEGEVGKLCINAINKLQSKNNVQILV